MDLSTGISLGQISHDYKLDWLELNETGRKMLFRDKKLKLHLYDIETQTKDTILNYCAFVQVMRLYRNALVCKDSFQTNVANCTGVRKCFLCYGLLPTHNPGAVILHTNALVACALLTNVHATKQNEIISSTGHPSNWNVDRNGMIATTICFNVKSTLTQWE